MNSSHKSTFKLSLIALLVTCGVCRAAQISVGIEHDMSKPTYGLHGQSSSSVTYDDKNGLNLKGAINDILGPPIKIANGFSNMISGGNMAGIGSSLKSGGAVLGIDAKMLEAAGGANLMKGGFLLGGSAAKTGLATALHGLPGKKISSIIEMPVKVMALKDLGIGKTLAGLGKVKGAEALAAKTKGDTMIREGEALKAQGMNQVLQGATEGMQNIGNFVQQTSGNAATAIKLLPIVLDLPMQDQQQQQQQVQQDTKTGRQQTTTDFYNHHPLVGGSLFGGLSSMLTGGNDPLTSLLTGNVYQANNNNYNRNPFSLFGLPSSHGYAAVLNTTNPLTNLLMNPAMNPFLLPLTGGLSNNLANGGPLAQSVSAKLPPQQAA